MGWFVGEVEPCPFCGYIGKFSPRPFQYPEGERFWVMTCGACAAQGPPEKDAEEATRKWNAQRVRMGVKLEDARKEIHRLRKVIEEYARTGTYKYPGTLATDPMELVDRPEG